MDQIIAGIACLVVLLVGLAAGVWIALALLLAGVAALLFTQGVPIGPVAVNTIWAQSSAWSLTSLPLFVWMGEILFRTNLSRSLFEGLAPWLTWLPGRLLHVNILGAGLFAAVSGSSSATCATVGKITLPELARQGYDQQLSIGTLVVAGTLGLIIPPSIMMVVYGVAAEVSIARLFLAGIGPGILLIILFMSYVAVVATMQPSRFPQSHARISAKERLASLPKLIPIGAIITVVIGSLYSGLATATESAAIGVTCSLILALLTKSLNWETFRSALMAAVRTSCMITFILGGSAVLTVAMAYTGIPRAITDLVSATGLGPGGIILILTVVFILLGTALDGISLIVLTTSVILPVVQNAGIDLIWFGIFMIIMVEIGEITPPVGFNIFVVQGMTGHDLPYIAYAALPFFCLCILAVALIYVFPGIVVAIPDAVFSR